MKEFHPVADVFPLMEGTTFESFCASIAKEGQHKPIELHTDGRIIDGRNRARACETLGVDPLYTPWTGTAGDEVAYVIKCNLERYHYNESQRAMVASRLATLGEGRPRTASIEAVSQSGAAAALNVARSSVQRARTVLNDGIPELVSAVDSGEIAVSTAASIASLPPEQQGEAVHNHRAQGTGQNEWYTPTQYVEAARAVMETIDLDPASSESANTVVGASHFFDAQADGLSQQWHGNVFLNPPYSQPAIMQFVEKLVAEVQSGRTTQAISLTHNYTDTAWFHLLANACDAICFTRGRIAFVAPDGTKAAPTQGQAFCYFGENSAEFRDVFSTFGFVVTRA